VPIPRSVELQTVTPTCRLREARYREKSRFPLEACGNDELRLSWFVVSPTLKEEGLRGGVLYHDGQFDDSRLAMDLAKTAVDFHAAVLNTMA